MPSLSEKDKSIISLREYFGKKKTFIIPDYQRGYIWGKNNPQYLHDSVTNLLMSLDKIIGQTDKHIFLQGVTVIETTDNIVIIDGQQRTTCLYIILKMLEWPERISIKYDIRKESDNELKKIGPGYDFSENKAETFQDIFYFKKTARLVAEHYSKSGFSKEDICNDILDKVKLLYIDIKDPEQQSLIFSMMNGNKAKMLDEEIIKADLLRIASLTPKSNEYENDTLRSRYAREWDRWLYWWNREDVARLFMTEGKMLGWLIPVCYCNKMNKSLDRETATISYEQFREAFLGGANYKTAKDVFVHMRRIQKRFEDIYNDPICYNYVGAILKISEKQQALAFILWFFKTDKLLNEESRNELKRYYRWCFLGHTHQEILKNEFSQEKFNNVFEILFKLDVYNDKAAYNKVAQWLLMLNIDQDCNQKEEGKVGRKFDFSIWDERSLEHIFPKSLVSHEDPDNPSILLGGDDKPHDHNYLLKRSDLLVRGVTEHSIGNLVLLYGRDNSSFGKKEFPQKKEMFFSLQDYNVFHSRHLIHTISIFAQSKWEITEIANNQSSMESSFRHYYDEFLNQQSDGE